MTGSDTMGGGMYGSDRDGVRAAFADGAVSFWEALDALVGGAEIVVDRPRGSHHPDFPEFVYELDYGYLKGTTSADGEGIDVWIGSDPRRQVTGALCTVDLVKHDAELKILVGCTIIFKTNGCAFKKTKRCVLGEINFVSCIYRICNK